MVKTVGILALQGDFEAHRKAIERAAEPGSCRAVEVRTSEQMAACDGLIVPGGESTTMLKLLEIENLVPALTGFAKHKPVFGTCAGAILMAQSVTHPEQRSFGLLDIDIERNAYGRQIDSRIAPIATEEGEVEGVFIRAPIIRRVGEGVRVLATYRGDPVWVEQGRHMATTFHPELGSAAPIHRKFLSKL